jgi:hypothetical protein
MRVSEFVLGHGLKAHNQIPTLYSKIAYHVSVTIICKFQNCCQYINNIADSMTRVIDSNEFKYSNMRSTNEERK